MSEPLKGFKDNTNPTFESVLVGLNREGVSVRNRKIYIPEITMESPLLLTEFIDYIIDFSEKGHETDPITLLIGTYGGESYGMFGVIDLIRAAPMKINTTAVGAAFSAGAWILAAGTGVRKAYENAYVMVHQFRGGQDGTMHEMAQTNAHFKHMQKRAEQMLAQYTNKDEKFWNRTCKKEFYMDAVKALEIGLIDEIIKVS